MFRSSEQIPHIMLFSALSIVLGIQNVAGREGKTVVEIAMQSSDNDQVPPTMFTRRPLLTSRPKSERKKGLTGEQKLMYYLLKDYERDTRPVYDPGNPVLIRFGITLVAIFDMDERKQVLTTNVWLDHEWQDELLRWNPEDFNNVTSFRIPCDRIWLPDIVIYNNADDYDQQYMRARAMIYHTGTVFWPPPAQIKSTCKMDVTYFPFDTQRCYLKFGSWTYHGLEVDIRNRSETVDLTNYMDSGEYELLRVIQRRRVVKYTCCDEPYPDVVYVFLIRRKLLYYIINIIVPCALMSGLTLLVFLLPPDSGEKIALGVTVLLAFSVFILNVAEKMPETSDSYPLIGIYLTMVIALSCLSVIMTVAVLNIHHQGPFQKQIPAWVDWLILQKIRPMIRISSHAASSNKGQQPKGKKRKLSLLRRLEIKKASENIQTDLLEEMGVLPKAKKTSMAMNAVQRALIEATTKAVIQREIVSEGDNPHLLPLIQKPTSNSWKEKANNIDKDTLQKEVLQILQILLSRQNLEDECEEVSHEWRQVAEVVDRLLFWFTFILNLIMTLTLLVFVPACRRRYDIPSDKEIDAIFNSV